MPKVVLKEVRVCDLPPELTAELDPAPDDVVRVTVDAGRREDLAKLPLFVEGGERRGQAARPHRGEAGRAAE